LLERQIIKLLSAIAFFICIVSTAFAETEQSHTYCLETIATEKEKVRVEIEKSQQYLDRYLAWVKKQEANNWGGSSEARKKQILGDIDLIRGPIEKLKKTKFTNEKECQENIERNTWSTRAFVINTALENRAFVPLAEIRKAWENEEASKLREYVGAAEDHVEKSCIFVTFDRPIMATLCSSSLYVFFDSTGLKTVPLIIEEARKVFGLRFYLDPNLPDCRSRMECYLQPN